MRSRRKARKRVNIRRFALFDTVQDPMLRAIIDPDAAPLRPAWARGL
ncbi:hypothetical protein ACCAA_130186 [Candidatus Accumulibacter aalborgensis]|uniref:Uncharacterized protein n=1 Tax=Candidatus Accumulibacter aalborgensis TaxID=1860102 RepID=A0A1A8XHV6_9PROT|nr:hypothetical protein [Candidatus Accumulibacter aalborgensis]SBT04276.1 hypothetical protein ACCAA_130186 [Candidatus Accumulibacter aalborgensis]